MTIPRRPQRAKRPKPNAHGPAQREMAVVHLVSEYWPFARTGGLAEAVRGIATYEAAAGVPTAVIMPFYRRVREQFPELEPFGGPFTVQVGSRIEDARMYQAPKARGKPRVLFVESSDYFDRDGLYGDETGDYPDNDRRYAFFCTAALACLPRLAPEPPILHAHDWHTVLAPIYLRTKLASDGYYSRVTSVLSVHNAAFQGMGPPSILTNVGLPDEMFHWKRLEFHGKVNLLKGGLVYSDLVTTVSPGHARELRTPAGGFGLHEVFIHLQDRFRGILNGIDQNLWNPETDPDIGCNYTIDDPSGKAKCKALLQDMCGLPVNPRIPLFGMSARLVHQKGLDLILGAELLTGLDAQFIFLGEGEDRYKSALSDFAQRAPDRIVTRFDFTEKREHQLLAGADLLLMPSLYEPCGLTQMRAQRYGALPVARNVGGLADTVEDQVTGFLFDEYEPEALARTVQRAVDLYNDEDAWPWHVKEAMRRDFGWEKFAEEYFRAYHQAVGYHARLL